jgi:hypothetical protein
MIAVLQTAVGFYQWILIGWALGAGAYHENAPRQRFQWRLMTISHHTNMVSLTNLCHLTGEVYSC